MEEEEEASGTSRCRGAISVWGRVACLLLDAAYNLDFVFRWNDDDDDDDKDGVAGVGATVRSKVLSGSLWSLPRWCSC
jgi:hypothetical protein